jgi:hypothetical protein
MRACEAAKLIDEMTPADLAAGFSVASAPCVKHASRADDRGKARRTRENPPANHGE